MAASEVDRLKLEGNAAFAAQRYDDAAALYTRAIDLGANVKLVQSLEANWRGATGALRQMKGAESKAAFAAGIATQCRTKLSEMGK